VEAVERGKQRLHVVLLYVARIERRVRLAQHVEDGALSFGGIEVVVESVHDALGSFFRERAGGRIRSRSELRTRQPEAEIAQLLDRTGGGLESVKREVQLV